MTRACKMANRVMVQTWRVMMNIRRQKGVILNVGWGWDIYMNIGFSPRPGLSIIKKSMVGNGSNMRGYMGMLGMGMLGMGMLGMGMLGMGMLNRSHR